MSHATEIADAQYALRRDEEDHLFAEAAARMEQQHEGSTAQPPFPVPETTRQMLTRVISEMPLSEWFGGVIIGALFVVLFVVAGFAADIWRI